MRQEETAEARETRSRVTHRLAGAAVEKVVQRVHIPEKVTQEGFREQLPTLTLALALNPRGRPQKVSPF